MQPSLLRSSSVKGRWEMSSLVEREVSWTENVFKMRGIWVHLFVDGNESVKRRKLMMQKMKGDNGSVMLLSRGEWLGSRAHAESPTLGRCWLVARRQTEDTWWADTSWNTCWWGSIPVFWVHLMFSEQGSELGAKVGQRCWGLEREEVWARVGRGWTERRWSIVEQSLGPLRGE